MDKALYITILDYAIRAVALFLSFVIMNFIKKHNLEKWAKIAVNIAEQIYAESGKGPEKKEYVRKVLKEKFKVNNDELNILIDGVVAELNNTVWKK